MRKEKEERKEAGERERRRQEKEVGRLEERGELRGKA